MAVLLPLWLIVRAAWVDTPYWPPDTRRDLFLAVLGAIRATCPAGAGSPLRDHAGDPLVERNGWREAFVHGVGVEEFVLIAAEEFAGKPW
jgi:hypothetical protein